MPSHPPLTPPHVLVVDDSALVRLSLARRLRSAGFEVTEAGSAAAARAAIEGGAGHFTCALLDLDLGDGDGVAVAGALRALAPGVPVGFFTGDAPSALVSEAGGLGPVFSKPADFDGAVAWVVAFIAP